MRYSTFLIACFFLTACGCSEPPAQSTGQAESPSEVGSKTSDVPDAAVIKSYVNKIHLGMPKEDVEKITGIVGSPKENNPELEQVLHYDYNNSYIEIVYSVDPNYRSFTVLKTRHLIDNLTIDERNKKRSEALARRVQQRRDIMKKKHEAENRPPNKPDAGDGL